MGTLTISIHPKGINRHVALLRLPPMHCPLPHRGEMERWEQPHHGHQAGNMGRSEVFLQDLGDAMGRGLEEQSCYGSWHPWCCRDAEQPARLGGDAAGAEPLGMGSTAPASALDAVAKSQQSLNAKQLGGLESCPVCASPDYKAPACKRLPGGSTAY